MTTSADLLKEIKKHANVLITTHHKPDADALGSSLGLYNFLVNLGVKAVVVTPTDYPDFLFWMKGNESVVNFEEQPEKATTLAKDADFIFCLDFNRLTRINEFGEVVRNSNAKKVLIDHHEQPEDFAHYSFWSKDTSSTCELVYDFIMQSMHESFLDKEIASCLYAGIMADTGSFRFASCSAKTHNVVAALRATGMDHVAVHEKISDSFTLDRTRLIGYAISQKLEILSPYKVALIYLDKNELETYNVKTGDTEGLVNYGLSIKGIKLAALIIDRTKMVKMSFRSKGDFDVNELAKKYFNGGGHKNAAGGSSFDSLETTVERFKNCLGSYTNDLI